MRQEHGEAEGESGAHCWNPGRDESVSNQGGCGGHGERCLDLEHILKVEPMGLADGLDMSQGRFQV